MEVLRRGFRDQGLSTAAGDLIVAGNRPTTRAAYKSAFNIWKDWCSARGTDPLSCSLNTALEFLTEQFHEGKSSSTINVYRHMLSTTFGQVGKFPIGTHPQVCKLMAGVYNSPRYSGTWNPDTVLQFIKGMKLTGILHHYQKLANLLALTTLRRCGELASIALSSVPFSPQGLSPF